MMEYKEICEQLRRGFGGIVPPVCDEAANAIEELILARDGHYQQAMMNGSAAASARDEVDRIKDGMGKIEWKRGHPPTNDRAYLIKFRSGIVCTGEYRYGRNDEPQPNTIAWRCECCGRYATPEFWATVDGE